MALLTKKYKKRLSSIKKGVTKQFGKNKAINWRNRDFEDLSFEINKASKVLISAATLKRIFGKNKTSETYYPQESTLEAMEKYIGVEISDDIPTFSFLQKKHFILFIIPVLIIVTILLLNSKKPSSEKLISATIELNKIDGANPATAFFNYQIPEIQDSLFISFGDEYPLQHLSATKNTISHYYRHPGIFDVSIKTRKQIVSDTLKLFIPTEGWQALAYYYQQEHTERYFPIPIELTTSDDGFHPTRKNLVSIGMDDTQIVVLRLDNFKKTGSNGDSFKLKTRIKNVNYWPAIRCYSGYIKVIGENGLILIKLTNEGCSQFGELTLSEKTAHGSSSDLTGLTLNIKEWNTVEIKNKEKKINLNINNQLVYQNDYTQSIGNIVGVSLQFHGSGYVDYFKIYDKENKPIFVKEF